MIICSMKCSLTLMVLYFSVLISTGYALAEENHPNILVLNSYHQGENWTDNETAGIFGELLTQYPTLVPLVETLDTKRYPSPAHLDFLRDYLLRKYHDRRIDLIIALDNPALNLIAQNPTELFPDVPVVFAGINGFRPEMIADRRKVTGVIERQDVAGTLKMALAMHPKVSRVLAVHDYTASGLAVRQETETALAQFAGQLKISYSADVSFDTLSEELKEMPDNGLVLILTYVTDKAGHTFTREESTRLISSLSPAPVYAMHETRLGFGIMGGLLLEGKEHGRQAARLAFRVLQGEDPDRIAVEESHSRSILDFQGLRRFKIPEDLWPRDALVVNRPISFWNLHKNVLIPSIAAIIVLLGLSLMLLGAVVRLRHAKKTIHKSEEKYRVLFSSFPLGITVSAQDGKIIETNAMATMLLGVPKEEHEKRKVDGAEWCIVRPDGTPMPIGEYASTRALQEKRLVENIEMGVVKPDAGITWLSVTAAPLNLEDYGVVVTYADVTARRGAEEENRRFKVISDNSVYGKAIADLEGNLLYVNRFFANIHGYTPEQLIGKHLSLFHSQEQMEEVDRLNASMIRDGYFASTTVWHSHQDGTAFPMLMSGVLIKDDYGNPHCIAVSAIDMTSQHQVEARLVESEKILRDIVESTLSGFWDWNLVANTEYLSPTFKRMFGYDDHEMENSPEAWQRIIFPEDLSGVLEVFDRHVKSRGREPFYNEIRYRHRDGSTVWVICAGRVIKWAKDGAPIRMVGCHINITERKQAEEAVAQSNKLLQTIINTAPVRIFYKDSDLRYIGCNNVFASDAGVGSPENLVGKDDYQLAWKEQAELYRTDDLHVLESGTPKLSYDEPQTTPEGKQIWLRTSKVPLLNEENEIIGVLGMYEDITDRKQAEEEREKLQVQLQQAQKMEAIGTLAGGIAHDFNNILGAILGYAEMVQEDSPPGSIVRKDIDQVVKASYRAKDLVKQILAFSRQDKTDQIPLQPGIIIKEALKMLRSSLPATIDIRQDIDPEAGLILADPTHIHQVMVNLCTNAFHAMEETGGTLTISLKMKTLSQNDLANEPRVQPGNFVQLSISDTGPGIAPEIQAKMFDPYFTTKEVGKGTGMGLAIIHGIAKSYKGFVTCQSQLGEGTVFQVYLPIIVDPSLHEIKTAPLDLTQLGNERILFIDDEEILAEMGQAMLERLGYRVTVRRNSIEALNTFQNQPDKFDLVITDQTMPGMTGSDLARRMLQIRPGIPIILCTGYSTLVSEEKAKGVGIKGFAMKPLAKKDIAALIREVLDGGKPLS